MPVDMMTHGLVLVKCQEQYQQEVVVLLVKVTLTATKVRKVSSPKGRRKKFNDKITLKIDGTTFDMLGRFYRKLRSGGKGN